MGQDTVCVTQLSSCHEEPLSQSTVFGVQNYSSFCAREFQNLMQAGQKEGAGVCLELQKIFERNAHCNFLFVPAKPDFEKGTRQLFHAGRGKKFSFPYGRAVRRVKPACALPSGKTSEASRQLAHNRAFLPFLPFRISKKCLSRARFLISDFLNSLIYIDAGAKREKFPV